MATSTAPAATPAAAPGTLDAETLAQDLSLILRLSAIGLTDDQLDKLLALYKTTFNTPPAELDAKAAARAARRAKLDLTDQEIKTLTSVRERLISGGMVAPHELQVAWKMVGGKRAANYLPGGLLNASLIVQVQAILTPDQLEKLVRPVQLKVAKQPGPMVTPILARLTKLRDADDEHWAAGVEDIAISAAAQAGQPDSDAYKQTYQNLMECFAHIRKMDDKQFAEGQAEILENLRVLFPADYDPRADVVPTARQTRQILTVVFLCTRTPVLLQEMKQARVGK